MCPKKAVAANSQGFLTKHMRRRRDCRTRDSDSARMLLFPPLASLDHPKTVCSIVRQGTTTGHAHASSFPDRAHRTTSQRRRQNVCTPLPYQGPIVGTSNGCTTLRSTDLSTNDPKATSIKCILRTSHLRWRSYAQYTVSVVPFLDIFVVSLVPLHMCIVWKKTHRAA